MENSASNTDLIRSHVITIILRSLENNDKYGYEICREIEVKSEGSYVLKQPTLYSCLKRLEAQEYITSYYGEISNGGKRRYYSLTDKGREYLEKDKQEWEFSRTLINRLLSDKDFDLTTPPPFNPSELRPYTRKMNEFGKEEQPEPKVVEKVVEVEKIVEKIVYVNKPEPQTINENQTEQQKDASSRIDSPAQKPVQLDIFSTLETKEEPEVNYKNAFSKLFDTPKTEQAPITTESVEQKEEKSEGLPETISELKKNYYSEGYNLKPYSFSNVVIYYNMNYVYTNKLNLLTYWIMYAFLLVEIGLIRLIFGMNFGLSEGLYLGSVLGGLILPGVPTVLYFLEPLKRAKANFDFKTSITNRTMLCLQLAFIFLCLGLFVWQVNLQDLSSMVLPIFIPIILLLNFPLSSVVYNQIYKTKKFHLT